jgi:hypothetical protein
MIESLPEPLRDDKLSIEAWLEKIAVRSGSKFRIKERFVRKYDPFLYYIENEMNRAGTNASFLSKSWNDVDLCVGYTPTNLPFPAIAENLKSDISTLV